jgi:hypothetical protein
MANDDHVAMLKKGVAAWNAWREVNPNIHPDLRFAPVRSASLRFAPLSSDALLRSALMRSAPLRFVVGRRSSGRAG